MSHVTCAPSRDPEQSEFVVAPERAVDEYEIAGGEPAEHVVVEPGQAGHVGEDAAAGAVAEHEPARLELDARSIEVTRCVTADRERLDREARAVEWAARAPGSSVCHSRPQ